MKKEKHSNSMFLNKDGYAKSVDISIPSQNIRELTQEVNQVLEVRELDIPTGDVAEVKGTKSNVS